MKDNSQSKSSLALGIVLSTTISLIITAVFMLIFAAILSKQSSAEWLVCTLSMTAQALGAVAGGFVCAKIIGHNGLLMGAIIGAVLFVIFTLIALISGSGFSIVSIIRLALLLVCSTLGGILGVNLKKKPNII